MLNIFFSFSLTFPTCIMLELRPVDEQKLHIDQLARKLTHDTSTHTTTKRKTIICSPITQTKNTNRDNKPEGLVEDIGTHHKFDP